jgi:predicted nucleotidyltransferase
MVNFPQLTKSRLRQKLLGYFFTNPQANLYVREVSSILKEDAGNISKELSNLGKDGIFISSIRGNQKYFSLNKRYPLYKELKSVIFKTIGIEGSLKEIVENDNGIKIAFIYGSFAESKENALSDIDLFIVGSPNEDKLLECIDNLEAKLGRKINYNIYPEKELKEKVKKRDSFITNILKRPKVVLKGKLSGF